MKNHIKYYQPRYRICALIVCLSMITPLHQQPLYAFNIKLPTLPSFKIPTVPTNIIIRGGAATALLIMGAVALYRYYAVPTFKLLSDSLELLDQELQDFVQAYKLYNSNEYYTLYKWFSKEGKFLSQYTCDTSIFPIKYTDTQRRAQFIEQMTQQNKRLRTLLGKIKRMNNAVFKTITKQQLIEHIEDIAYIMSYTFNNFIKDDRPAWQRFIFYPDKGEIVGNANRQILESIQENVTNILTAAEIMGISFKRTMNLPNNQLVIPNKLQLWPNATLGSDAQIKQFLTRY